MKVDQRRPAHGGVGVGVGYVQKAIGVLVGIGDFGHDALSVIPHRIHVLALGLVGIGCLDRTGGEFLDCSDNDLRMSREHQGEYDDGDADFSRHPCEQPQASPCLLLHHNPRKIPQIRFS